MRALALAALITAPAAAQEAVQPENTYDVSAVKSATAEAMMVIAAHPMASEAGFKVLQAGGTAVDAAIAAQLMLNVVEPQSSGLGGGAFAVIWDAAAGRLTTYDGRETAPLAADETYWLKPDGKPMGWRDAVPGGRSVGVPGTPALLEYMHDRHGELPLAALAEDAAAAAEGFAVSPRLAASIATGGERGLNAFPRAAATFFDAAGAPLAEGATLANAALAASIRRFGAEGAAPFYSGDLAQEIVAATTGAPVNPGILTMADFAAYEVKERAPVCLTYRGHDVCGMGPPSSGALTVGQILGMLEAFDLSALGPSAEAWRLFAEANRLAFADRGLYMADSDFTAMPEGLLNRAYLAERAEEILADVSGPAEPGSPPWKDGALRAPDTDETRPGTTHIVTRDASGNVVSMTSTIETGFGSRLMANGYLLNNELTDFSRIPSRDGMPIANRVEGGKRPRSSMAPTIVMKDGAPVMALGSPGGSRIIAYVAASLVALIDWDLTPTQTAALGHVTASGGRVDLEAGTGAELLEANMRAYGLEPRVRDLNSGLAIMTIGPDGLSGAADPRREGLPLGE